MIEHGTYRTYRTENAFSFNTTSASQHPTEQNMRKSLATNAYLSYRLSPTFSVLRRVVLAQVAVHLIPLVDKVDDHGGGVQEGQVVGAAHAEADVAGVLVDAALLQEGQVPEVVVRPAALLPKLDKIPVCRLGSGDVLCRNKCLNLRHVLDVQCFSDNMTISQWVPYRKTIN